MMVCPFSSQNPIFQSKKWNRLHEGILFHSLRYTWRKIPKPRYSQMLIDNLQTPPLDHHSSKTQQFRLENKTFIQYKYVLVCTINLTAMKCSPQFKIETAILKLLLKLLQTRGHSIYFLQILSLTDLKCSVEYGNL